MVMQSNVEHFSAFEIVSLPQRSDVGKSFVGLQGVVAGFGRMGDCKNIFYSFNMHVIF